MKPSQTLISAAKAVVTAKALVETLRPKVHEIQDNLIHALSPKVDPKYKGGRRGTDDEYVTRENAWMMTDEDAARYYEELDKEYRKAGFTEIEKGQCPLLIAENNLRVAESLFGDACVELTARVGLDSEKIKDLMCCVYGLEERNKFVELNLKYVVPFIPRKELWMRA